MAESNKIGNLIVDSMGAFDAMLTSASELSGVKREHIMVSIAYFDMSKNGGSPTFTYSFVDVMDRTPIVDKEGDQIKGQFSIAVENE